MTYTVVKDPSGGGKVLPRSATGNFSFLPDFSSVQNGTPEDFSVLVAETTPFDAALTQIPLIGSFVPQILVVLYQVPIVNVVLAPLIGRVRGRSGHGSLSEPLQPSGTPVAFTVKVPSPVDGALISTNYFPATTVVNGATGNHGTHDPQRARPGHRGQHRPQLGVDSQTASVSGSGTAARCGLQRGHLGSARRVRLRRRPAAGLARLRGPGRQGHHRLARPPTVRTRTPRSTTTSQDPNAACNGRGRQRSGDRHGRRVLRRRHPAGDRRHRSACRCDRAGHRLEQPRRLPIHERGVQDVVLGRAAAGVGYDGRADQPADLPWDPHRRPAGHPHSGPDRHC